MVAAIVLLVTNTGQLVSADEGALLSQVKILSDTGEWGAVNPSPTIDPEGTWFPLDLTEQVDGRFFPFAKRPVYAAVSFLAYEVGLVCSCNLFFCILHFHHPFLPVLLTDFYKLIS